jgi:hypothetical protein
MGFASPDPPTLLLNRPAKAFGHSLYVVLLAFRILYRVFHFPLTGLVDGFDIGDTNAHLVTDC